MSAPQIKLRFSRTRKPTWERCITALADWKRQARKKGQCEAVHLFRISPGLTNMYNRILYTFKYIQKRVRHTKSVSFAQRGCDTNLRGTCSRAQEWFLSSDYVCQQADVVFVCKHFRETDGLYAPVSALTPSSQSWHYNVPQKRLPSHFKNATPLHVNRTTLTSTEKARTTIPRQPPFFGS